MSENTLFMPVPSAPLTYLTRNQVAEIFSVSVRTVENWRANEILPRSFSMGGRTYWDIEEIRNKVNSLRAQDSAGEKLFKIPAVVGSRPPKAGVALAKSKERDKRVLKDLMSA